LSGLTLTKPPYIGGNPKFSNRAEFAQWADENPVLSGLTLTKPPYIGGFRHFAIENLV
jgi:hypothetical protein